MCWQNVDAARSWARVGDSDPHRGVVGKPILLEANCTTGPVAVQGPATLARFYVEHHEIEDVLQTV
eukprot:CAMPEP_0195127694 /NCGR_PEP_ID=MMETSP0448-20130528/137540_1 /TAXON_ID=66468 /ORGANISM="Heterocapsa triquestra, Strain CCMP 448" /LENGTH=65 /DNA_ID=CAMNT_0040165451 /DNA_START=82 /DNA_END=275 /DNA_ORIENTATION=-